MVRVLMIFKRQDHVGASSLEAMPYNFIISLSGADFFFLAARRLC